MKERENSNNDENLRQVLGEWKVDASLPPRFQEQVWQRISRLETSARPAFWERLVGLFEIALPRPKFALSYVAALLVLGVAGGAIAAQVQSNRLNAELSTRYVQSVDPYHAQTAQP